MFLQYLLKQDSDSLLHKFFQAQLTNPTKKDWCQVAKETVDELGLKLTLSQIKLTKEDKLKELVKEACQKKALEYLNRKKEDTQKYSASSIQHGSSSLT